MDGENMYGYRLLAGAIISRSVEDLVDLLIFIRDIRAPDNEDLVYRRADKSYKKYRRILAQNEKSKRSIRKDIAECRKQINDCKAIIENHEKVVNEYVWPDLASCTTAEERSIARITKKEMDKAFERRMKSIAKNKEKITKAEERIAYLQERVKTMKSEEKHYLRNSSIKTQRKALLNRARSEIAGIEEWFYSDQFVKLNACAGFDPDALIEKSYRAVRHGLAHPSNKYKPYFLRRDNDD